MEIYGMVLYRERIERRNLNHLREAPPRPFGITDFEAGKWRNIKNVSRETFKGRNWRKMVSF
jgi:hypothetical protein